MIGNHNKVRRADRITDRVHNAEQRGTAKSDEMMKLNATNSDEKPLEIKKEWNRARRARVVTPAAEPENGVV